MSLLYANDLLYKVQFKLHVAYIVREIELPSMYSRLYITVLNGVSHCSYA